MDRQSETNIPLPQLRWRGIKIGKGFIAACHWPRCPVSNDNFKHVRKCYCFSFFLRNFCLMKCLVKCEMRNVICMPIVTLCICHVRTQWGCWNRARVMGPREGGLESLSYWGRDKMDAISQTPFSNAFSWMKMLEYWLTFHWSLFLRLQLTISQHWFR